MAIHHTSLLYPYIHFAPEDIQAKFTFLDDIEKPLTEKDSSFIGLLFRDCKVYCYNILIFDKDKDYQGEYLEITEIFNKLLKQYNIYHLCFITRHILDKYARENIVAENITPILKYDRPEFKPKFRYEITKHRGRERKSIKSDRKGVYRTWSNLFHSTIKTISYCKHLAKFRNEGYNSMFIDYTCQSKLSESANEYRTSISLQRQERKRNRGMGI